MPFLQILSGERADELFELHPSASLVVGTGPEAHIRLPDSRMGVSHCQVFPAQGSYWLRDMGQGPTVSNLRRVAANETARLAVRDILIVGHTFMRYLEERPAAAGPKGADPADLVRAVERVRALELQTKTLEAQLSALEGHAGGAHKERETARQMVSDLRSQLASAEDTSQRSGVELERARTRIQTLEKEQDKVRARLNEVQEEAKKALAAKAEEIQLSEEALAELDAEKTQARNELAEVKEALGKAERQVGELKAELAQVTRALQGELAQVKQEADDRVANASVEQRRRLVALEASLSAALTSLDASRAALRSLGVDPPAAPDRPDGVAPLELTAVLDAAGLSAEVRARLEQALAAHIDREALRRFSGPPFSWERPARAIEVMAELGSLRSRGERRLTEVRLATGTTTA